MKRKEKILRQNVGVDISKDTFDGSIIQLTEVFVTRVVAQRSFENTRDGYMKFSAWAKERLEPAIETCFTMEATGVYYEGLAYFLHGRGEIVHVVLPNKAKKYAESLDGKSKTDKLDAQMLGRMGAERQLRRWLPCSKRFKALRCLTRERESLIHERTLVKNQLHALSHSEDVCESSVQRFEDRVVYLTCQVEKTEADIAQLIESDQELCQRVKYPLSIPGIGLITVSTLIAETNGFAAIENLKQLSSYSGYDVRIRESGKWKGQPRISKKGNSHIRAALFFPACSASRHNAACKEDYERLKSVTGIPMVANTAIQRRLLGLVYTLWKNNVFFDEKHAQGQEEHWPMKTSGIA